MKKTLLTFFATIIMFSCNNENSALIKDKTTNKVLNGEYNNGLLIFKDINSLKKTYNTLKEMENPKEGFDKFYKNGFTPLKVSGYLTEEEAESFYYKKQKKHLNKSNKNNYPEKDLIQNELFANLLNEKGEIEVAGKIYKYTSKGIFSVDKENRKLLDNITSKANKGKAYKSDLVELYIPDKSKLPTMRIEPPREIEHPEDGGSGGSTPTPNIGLPTNTSHFSICLNTKDGWIDNIFGKSYACEYKFNSKKKLRTVFAAEDYWLFTDVYMQAKFKQKTWFGWFSDRSANKVYIKNKKSMFTMKTRNIDISINSKEAKKVYTKISAYIKKLLEKKETISYLSGVYDLDNKTLTSTQLSYNDLVMYANKPVFTPKKYVRKKFIDLDINIKNLFKGGANKVAVVNISGKNVLNFKSKDFYYYAGKALQSTLVNLRNNQKGAVIITNYDPDKDKYKPIAYFFENEIVEVKKLAIARRTFNLPKNFKVDKALLSFRDGDGKSDFVLDLKFTWDIVGSVSVDMESGAYYNGKWGGSKFRVEY